MSNGVEVIVRGHKTALVGFEQNTPWLPHRVNPSKPVTLPAHTVSRQFHLIEKGGKRPANQGIAHLLQSIVRSATPDMVTKTMLTTFTFMTTLLKNSNTIVKSREEVISNVVTEKFRPNVGYTGGGGGGEALKGSLTSFLTNTLTTTYIYYNTFNGGAGLPMVLSSRATVSNVFTQPAYLKTSLPSLSSNIEYGGLLPFLEHSEDQLLSTRMFETETYYSTYTFSNKPLKGTTKETVTQVVITEALLPNTIELLMTPTPTILPVLNLNLQLQQSNKGPLEGITKTYYTTFTHLFTELDGKGGPTVRSSLSILSQIVTQRPQPQPQPQGSTLEEAFIMTPTPLMATIEQTKTLTPVLLYATKVYYTTYTYFTTIRNKGSTGGRGSSRVQSRTQIVSRVVTEALSTAFDVNFVNQLKSSYLEKHSILLDVTSSIQEIIPTKTIELDEGTEFKGTLVTQQILYPHWPKEGGDEGEVFEFELSPAQIRPAQERPLKGPLKGPVKILQQLQVPISSSEEHFDEVKEGVHKIVSVLTNTKVSQNYLKPTRTSFSSNELYVYSTASPASSVSASSSEKEEFETSTSSAFEESTASIPIQQFTKEEEFSTTEAIEEPSYQIINETPVSHLPTPPLRNYLLKTSAASIKPSSEASTKASSTKASSTKASSTKASSSETSTKAFSTKVSSTKTYFSASKYKITAHENKASNLKLLSNQPTMVKSSSVVFQKIPEDKTDLDMFHMFPQIGPSSSIQAVIIDYPTDIVNAGISNDADFEDPEKDDGDFFDSNKRYPQASSSVLAKRTGTVWFEGPEASPYPRPYPRPTPIHQGIFPTSQILHLISDIAAESQVYDEDKSEEDPPPKIYNIPSTFDTMIKEQTELDQLNKTLQEIRRKQSLATSTATQNAIRTTTTTSYTTTTEPEMAEYNVEVKLKDVKEKNNNNDAGEDSIKKPEDDAEKQTEEEEEDESIENGGGDMPIKSSTGPITEESVDKEAPDKQTLDESATEEADPIVAIPADVEDNIDDPVKEENAEGNNKVDTETDDVAEGAADEIEEASPTDAEIVADEIEEASPTDAEIVADEIEEASPTDAEIAADEIEEQQPSPNNAVSDPVPAEDEIKLADLFPTKSQTQESSEEQEQQQKQSSSNPTEKAEDEASEEKAVIVSTKRPSKYTTSKRPNNKNTRRPPRPYRPVLAGVISEEEDSEESSTQIYSLKPPRFSSSSGENLSNEDDEDKPNQDKHNKDYKSSSGGHKESLEDSSDESLEIENQSRRPPLLYDKPAGPSKSGLSFPAAAVGSGIATAAATGFNWKPLLNLGAIGLGGLGASGLTKLGPLFNSVAGYMKGSIIPTIARNDTYQNPYKNDKKKYRDNPNQRDKQRDKQRDHYKGYSNHQSPFNSKNKEPIYIPLHNPHGNPQHLNFELDPYPADNPFDFNKQNKEKYRFSDGGIQRRPIVGHANEPNFRPIAKDRDQQQGGDAPGQGLPKLIGTLTGPAGPLPPPIHYHNREPPHPEDYHHSPFPSGPNGNGQHGNNFKPPNDNIPNLFTLIHEDGQSHDSHGYGHGQQGHGQENEVINIHKNGDPPPPDNPRDGSSNHHHQPNHPSSSGPQPGHSEGPQGKTEFIFRPLQNIMNGRPMFEHSSEGGGASPSRPQHGVVTPVLRPSLENLKGPHGQQRPLLPPPSLNFRPRPGPASIEMINEIKDSHNQNPSLILPQRRPFSQNQDNPEGLSNGGGGGGQKNPRLPWPFNNNKNDGNRFTNQNQNQQQNPFNNNPLEGHGSHESFETHFKPEMQRPFFNQPGFITDDHFNDITTASPLREPMPTLPSMHQNPQQGRPPPRPFKRPPMQQLFNEQGPLRPQRPYQGQGQDQRPPPPYFNQDEHEFQTSEESIHHPHPDKNQIIPGRFGNKRPGPFGQNNQGQNFVQRPQQDPNQLHLEREEDHLRIPFEHGNFGQKERPNQNQNQRPPPIQQQPPSRPSHDHPHDPTEHHESAENLFHNQQTTHSRPHPVKPSWSPARLPNGPPPPPRFLGPIGGNINMNLSPLPIPPDPIQYIPQRPRPSRPVPPQGVSTVYIIEQDEEGHHSSMENHQNQYHEESEEHHPNENHMNPILNFRPTPQEPHPHHPPEEEEESEEFHTEYPKLIIKEISTRPAAPYRSTTIGPPTQNVPTTERPNNQDPNKYTTNKSMISRLFIRRFTSTSTSTSTKAPPKTSLLEEEGDEELEEMAPSSGFGTTPPAPYGRLTPGPIRITTFRPISPWVSRTKSTTIRTTTTTSTPKPTLKGSLNTLLNFEQRFKQKYGGRRPNETGGGSIGNTSQNNSASSFPVPASSLPVPASNPHPLDKNYEDEYEDENEDEIQASSNLTLSAHQDHPNHHPIHKDPINVAKYLEGDDEFGQLYQGTEDSDTVIDPKSQKVIKSPFDKQNNNNNRNKSDLDNHRIIDIPGIQPRRNISNLFMRRTTSTTTVGTTLETTLQDDNSTMIGLIEIEKGGHSSTGRPLVTLKSSEEDEFLRRYTIPKDVIFNSTPPGGSSLWWPTTFRPKKNGVGGMDGSNEIDLLATTYRPKDNDGLSSELSIHRERPLLGPFRPGPPGPRPLPPSLRPAPQAGMASFYDDEDSFGQIKIKNKEIHKLPAFTKRPSGFGPLGFSSGSGSGLGIAFVRPEDMAEYESLEKLRDKLNKEADKIEAYNGEDNEAYEEEDERIEGLRPSDLNNNNNQGKGQGSNGGRPQGSPAPQPPSKPQQSARPGAFETLTNLFKRPQPQQNFGPMRIPGTPGPALRRPFIPQRPPQPPQSPKKQQQAPIQENTIQILKQSPIKAIVDNKKTGSSPQGLKVGGPGGGDTNGGTGHRESSYIYDSEYYEDDEEEEDGSNLIPPRPQNLQNNENKRPSSILLVNRPGSGTQRPSLQVSNNRPIPPGLQRPSQGGIINKPPSNVGGHLANNNNRGNNNNRPQPQPPQRPQFQGSQGLSSNQGFQRIQPLQMVPSAEMEPPPIDSNRLKPPVLELPSSGPIRYKPSGPANANGNINRPNLLRPDDELFKDQWKEDKHNDKQPTIHTIASVDDNNEIVGTNTFHAILPSKSSQFGGGGGHIVVKPTAVSGGSQQGSSPAAGSEVKVELEGSEANILIPSHSSGVNMQMSSVIKYTGGKLQTSAVLNAAKVEPEATPEEEEYEEVEEEESLKDEKVLLIQPSKTNQRGKGSPSSGASSSASLTPGNSTSTPLPPTSSTTIRVSTSSSSNSSRVNNRAQILNRRPPSNQILRSTTTQNVLSKVTLEGSTVSSESSNERTTLKPGTTIRRPFIPTRGPVPTNNNIIPWAKRTQGTTDKTTSTTTIIYAESAEASSFNKTETIPGTLKFTPSSNRGNNRFDSKNPNNGIISVSTSSSTSISGQEAPEKRTEFDNKPTSQRPPYGKKPYSGPGSSKENDKNKPAVLSSGSSGEKSRFTPTKRPNVTSSSSGPTKRPSVFQNVTRQVTSSRLPPNISTSSSDEYEEYSYEEEELIPIRPNQTVSVSVSTQINPTRVEIENSLNRGQGPSPNRFRPAPRPDNNADDDVPRTRFITSTESVTITVTETETSVFTSQGIPRTQTILITKTVPPQTLISTVVGSITLVNTVDVKPTIVKTTIISEPTRLLAGGGRPSFFDSSEKPETIDNKADANPESDLKTDTNQHPVGVGGIIRKVSGLLERPEPSPSAPGGNHRNKPFEIDGGCRANCSLSQNQACRSYANGTRTKCDCKAGYARMKDRFPCRPTFTYEMRLSVQHMDGMSFDFKDLYNAGTDGYLNFITVTKEAIDKAFLATDIKRQFQGSEIIKINPLKPPAVPEPKVNVDFVVQLTTNITEDRVKNHLLRTLKASNFSVGRSAISASRNASELLARDFNECLHKEFHDCSLNADCLNIKGSYSCKCKAGFKDRNKRKPGKDCQETAGCAECNFKGTCHIDTRGGTVCHCFKWYGGSECQINLKLPLIAVTGIGSVLFIVVVLCGILFARRSRGMPRGGRIERQGSGLIPDVGGRFLRYRSPASVATLERTAIMNDSASSEGRQSPHQISHPHTNSFTPDSLLIDVDPKGPTTLLRQNQQNNSDMNLMNFSLRNVVMEQCDRTSSLACVIPRAKIRTQSRPNSRHASVGADPNADLASTERKLMSYLDSSPYAQGIKAGPSVSTIRRIDSKQIRKFSLQEQRKIAQGALVSSGIEVSAIGGMRRRSTTGLEPPIESNYSGYEKSVSEVRSFDETIRSPAKHHLYNTDTSRASCYSCKPPSYCTFSESAGHTMGDKDGASTVYTTQGKLFRLAHDHDDDDTSSTISSQ